MTKASQTAQEVFDSLTGFDEIAITQQFGTPISELAEKDTSMFGRAMGFVLVRRDGETDDEARTTILGKSMKDLQAMFADESEESGKDEPSSVSQPVTLLPSAL